MTWSISTYRTGDLVEVLSKEEILATLDERGRTGGMPFMPEMLQYCGKRFRVASVAHKACDMIGKVGTCRKVESAVHLEGLRCDGSAHDGCQAECNIYWRDEWLKPTLGHVPRRPPIASACSEAQLIANTRQNPGSVSAEVRYSCQATQLYDASQPLAWWNPRQYLLDVTTGNRSLSQVISGIVLFALRRLVIHVPFGYRALKSLNDRLHLKFTGRGEPTLNGQIADGATSPTGRLDLRPGERVRIKSQAEIEATINRHGKNRGLSFDHEEMAPYCGQTFTVRKPVTQIIEEPTGKMLHMKQPCIMLDGVVCKAIYASCRLNCPREIPSYWRELWLERTEQSGSTDSGTAYDEGNQARSVERATQA